MPTIGVIRFPGTNNEWETVRALQSFGVEAKIVEHNQQIDDLDGIWLAGGFSYGDVLRAGAIAGASRIMKDISRSGRPVLGACNGFQILTEANLIEGALLPNTTTRFVCKWIYMTITENDSYLNELQGSTLRIPIAHFEGNFWSESTPENIVAKYSTRDGDATPRANPNGSMDNIAGLSSSDGRMVGMMPHPERSCFKHQGSTDGRKIIQAFLKEVHS